MHALEPENPRPSSSRQTLEPLTVAAQIPRRIARLLNEYGASGNLVGLIYNYQGSNGFYAGDYFEVMFSPTGIVRLNKVIQGVRYVIQSRTHNVPRNTWFNVQLIRSGPSASVKLNGVTIFDIVPMGDLRDGSVGVVTHWSKGRFDNATVSEVVSSQP